MSIQKPFSFVANTYAKSNEVNANFDVAYSQINTNISNIAKNGSDITNLENNKANINGSASEVFSVKDPESSSHAVNKNYLIKAIGNSVDYISGLIITKDSGSPEDTIIVSEGSCYDSTKSVVLSLANSLSKQNDNQGANATYYVYIIGTATGSLTDILISTSSTTPTLPSGYTLFRLLGSYTTDSDGNILYIYNHGSNNPDTKAVTIDTYVQGTSGYRIWSNGCCEQWGVANDPSTIYLLKEYKDTSYNVVLSKSDGWHFGNNGQSWTSLESKSVGSFVTKNNVVSKLDWRAIGYLVEGEY